MADLKVINVEIVSNPDLLVGVLHAFSTELRKYQSQINELIVDHSTMVECHNSAISGISTLGSCYVSGTQYMGSSTGATTGSFIEGSCLFPSTFTSAIPAGPAQLTASHLVSHFIDQSTYSNR